MMVVLASLVEMMSVNGGAMVVIFVLVMMDVMEGNKDPWRNIMDQKRRSHSRSLSRNSQRSTRQTRNNSRCCDYSSDSSTSRLNLSCSQYDNGDSIDNNGSDSEALP